MVLDRFRRCYEKADFSDIADLYADDALLDANVPSWRFQRKGSKEIRGQYEQWFAENLPRLASWVERPTEWGAAIEIEGVVGTGNEEVRFRELHLLVVEDDAIVEHISYCTGLWDRETVERHRAEAPMVRP